jgi:hypothetical protein
MGAMAGSMILRFLFEDIRICAFVFG